MNDKVNLLLSLDHIKEEYLIKIKKLSYYCSLFPYNLTLIPRQQCM